MKNMKIRQTIPLSVLCGVMMLFFGLKKAGAQG